MFSSQFNTWVFQYRTLAQNFPDSLYTHLMHCVRLHHWVRVVLIVHPVSKDIFLTLFEHVTGSSNAELTADYSTRWAHKRN